MASQFYPQFDEHLSKNATISIYDVQKFIDEDNLAIVKQ